MADVPFIFFYRLALDGTVEEGVAIVPDLKLYLFGTLLHVL